VIGGYKLNSPKCSIRRHTSVRNMLGQELQRIIESTEKYEVARKRAISDLRTGYHLGGIITALRKELHER
jgi:hypothetical protein